jgi:two-component system, NtrC family, nitrogen regulation sensor histidine kinase NtrY
MASGTKRGVAHAPSVRRVHRNLERSILFLTLSAGLPGVALLLYLLWQQDYSFEVRWTIVVIVAAVWIGSASLAYQMVSHVLFLQANLLGALREGDYSIRGIGADESSAVHLVMQEINALGDTLQRQRTEAVESTKLLQSVMAAIDVAVFAFDPDGKLVLVNPAAERLIGKPSSTLLGREAQQLRLAKYLTGDTPRLIDRPFGPESGPSFWSSLI